MCASAGLPGIPRLGQSTAIGPVVALAASPAGAVYAGVVSPGVNGGLVVYPWGGTQFGAGSASYPSLSIEDLAVDGTGAPYVSSDSDLVKLGGGTWATPHTNGQGIGIVIDVGGDLHVHERHALHRARNGPGRGRERYAGPHRSVESGGHHRPPERHRLRAHRGHVDGAHEPPVCDRLRSDERQHDLHGERQHGRQEQQRRHVDRTACHRAPCDRARAVDPTRPNVVYAGLSTNNSGPVIYRSVDGGATFASLITGLPPASHITSIADLHVSAANPDTVLAGLNLTSSTSSIFSITQSDLPSGTPDAGVEARADASVPPTDASVESSAPMPDSSVPANDALVARRRRQRNGSAMREP
jgi:hypothetical protein